MAFVFVASTGRCGTKFLFKVWETYTDYPCFHEPVPYCAGQTLREVNNECGINSDTRKELKTKILQVLSDSKDGNYFESNQMFIKSYLSQFVYDKRFRSLCVIYLHRDPLSVAMSYFKHLPDRDMSWHLQPQWQKNILRGRKGLGFIDITLWNCLEIRERFLLWKDKFDKTYDLDFELINDPREHAKIFDHFEIKHKEMPSGFPRDLYHPKHSLNAIPADESEILKKMRLNWSKPGKDVTKSAQEHFFGLIEKRISELQSKEKKE